MDLSTIQTPTQFIAFMEMVWDAKTEPGPNGGLVMFQHPDYDQFHDAGRNARLMGLKRTGGHRDANVYRFQSGEGVVIGLAGDWIKLAKNRYSQRK